MTPTLRRFGASIISATTRPARQNPRFATAILLAYIVLTAMIAAHHEAWRDEADPWLVARDADAVTFLRRASLGGTPELWHLMLVPLARGGAPYDSQKVLHLAIAATSIALLLWRSPLPRLTTTAAAFSYYFAYEYAIIVRSYALSVLLLLAIAALYPTRLSHPIRFATLVALLANTNSHSLLIAAFLGMLYMREAAHSSALRLRWRPLALMLSGGIVAVAQMAADSADRAMSFVRIQFSAPWTALGQAFFPFAASPLAPLAAFVIVALATWWLLRQPALTAFLWLSYAALSLVFMFWWIGGPRHAGFLMVLLIFVIWIHMDSFPGERAGGVAFARTASLALLTISLIYSDVTTSLVYRLDFRYAYSGAKEAADFIISHGLENDVIAAHSQTTTSALAPYLRHPLWYIGIEDYGTFTMWDRKFDAGLSVPYPEAVRRVRERFDGRQPVLLLLNVELPAPEAKGFRLLYEPVVPVYEHTDERFWLYRLQPRSSDVQHGT